jgi:23S rRNA (pseudouridine1915-N3)-methyltransferase
MKIRLVWIGKTKDANLSGIISDFASRIRHFLPLEIVEIREPKVEVSKRLIIEAEKILGSISDGDRLVVLDPRGKSWNSEQFAQFVGKHMRSDPRALTFVIGGFSGLSDEVRRRADTVWALSPMTFTHDLSRLLVLEQIYRALTIIHGFPYSR